MHTTSLPHDYRAVIEAAALVDETSVGRIFMRGKDRAALLQRLSTNDVAQLRPGEGTRTVLTTPIGRIIDLLTVHALENELLLLTSLGQGPLVFGHLKKNIFFNDQVTLAPAGQSHGQLALYGPLAAETLAWAAGTDVPDLALHHSAPLLLAGAQILVARRPPLGGDGLTLFVPTEVLETTRAALHHAGAQTLSAANLDVLRVEQGYGAFGRELSQEYIPLETGLLDAVSFSKGCYVGQEIIARMESRGRLAKRLVGLRLSGASAEELPDVALPARLDVDGKDAGVLTSAVVSPRCGPIGLAYVRTAHADPGATVRVSEADVRGVVVELPFGEG
jgi:aminomethyltransferase